MVRQSIEDFESRGILFRGILFIEVLLKIYLLKTLKGSLVY